MCSLLESERPADLPPGMMEKILISSSGEPLVQAGSEDIPAEESMVTDAVMMAELEGITPASGYDGGKNFMNPQPMEVEESVTPVTHHPPHTHIGPILEPITSYEYDRCRRDNNTL